MIQAGNVRKGNVINYKDSLWVIIDTQEAHVGKRGKYAQLKMKNLDDGHIETQRFSTSDKIEKAFLETKQMTYLYEDTAGYVFMDPETGQQVHLGEEILSDMLPYLAYNITLDISFYQGTPVAIEKPANVTLEVVKTEPAVRGNTATNVTKPAEVETGLTVKVPGHIRKGDKIRVDTRTGEFMERA
jgi:elongation factor P